MLKKVLALALGLGLIVQGVQARSLEDVFENKELLKQKRAEISSSGKLDLMNLDLYDLKGLDELKDVWEDITILDVRNNDLDHLYASSLTNVEYIYYGDNPRLEINVETRVGYIQAPEGAKIMLRPGAIRAGRDLDDVFKDKKFLNQKRAEISSNGYLDLTSLDLDSLKGLDKLKEHWEDITTLDVRNNNLSIIDV